MIKRMFAVVSCSVLLCSFAFAENNTFEEANQMYEDKKYQEAIAAYEAILSGGQESASLYFNLGNAYFKNGDLGHAILYYLKAKRLAPADEDIIHNLEFAGKFSSVQMEGVELNPVTAFLASLVEKYKLSLLAWLASFFFMLFVVSLIFRYALGYNRSAIRIFVTVSFILVLLSAGLTTFKYRYDYLTTRAVIISEESKVYTGASDQSDIELEAAPGLIVEILSESSEYYNVLFENKRRGWIKKELVAVI